MSRQKGLALTSKAVFWTRNRRKKANTIMRKPKKSLGKNNFEWQLEKAFWKSISQNTKDLNEAAVLFSAGIDSALIAKAVSKRAKNTVLFCAGIEGSRDLETARKTAEEMKLKLVERIVSEKEIKQAIPEVKAILSKLKLDDALNLQIAVSEFFAMQAVKKTGIKIVFMGQGADELFAGYDAFRKIVREKGLKAVNAECKKFLEKASKIDLKRDKAIAKHFGLELRLPYCDKEFAKAALRIPACEKIKSENDLLRKHALRKLAKKLKVPEDCYSRPKKAMQYGSGIGKKIKKVFQGAEISSKFP